MFGYGFYLNRQHEGILDDIWVRSLLLKNKDKTLLFLSYDLLLLPMKFINSLKNTLSNTLTIPCDHIFIGCTHTHSAPTTETMFGIGKVDPKFIEFLIHQTNQCIEPPKLENVQLFDHEERIESIAYNRRHNNFKDVDNRLRSIIVKFKQQNIYLYNLACHTVVLGKEKLISGDWVGAVNQSLTNMGDEGIFFQGCSGNLDPMTNLNRKGQGQREDLEIIGNLVASRLKKGLTYGHPIPDNAEIVYDSKKIKIKINPPEKKEIIDIEKENWILKVASAQPGYKKFLEEWASLAKARLAEIKKSPWLEVKIEYLQIGQNKIIIIPGEVDSQYALNLDQEFSRLHFYTLTNGSQGYFPNEKAYEDEFDYACYNAPKFYGTIFPFDKKVQRKIDQAIIDLIMKNLYFNDQFE